MPDITSDDDAIKALLASDPKIAMIGASADPSRPSNGVFAYLQSHGFTVVPVTPKTDPVHGVEPVADLEAAKERLGGTIDIVDVFRAKEHTPGVAKEAADAGAKALWLQLGTDHQDAIATAVDAGLQVVADRCIKVEHARLF